MKPALTSPPAPSALDVAAAPIERAVDRVFRALGWRIWVTVTLAFLLLAPPETVGHPFFVGAHVVLLAVALGTTRRVASALWSAGRATAGSRSAGLLRAGAWLAIGGCAAEAVLVAADAGIFTAEPVVIATLEALDAIAVAGALALFFAALRLRVVDGALRRRCEHAQLALAGFAVAFVGITAVSLSAPAAGLGARWLLAPTLLGAAFYVLGALHAYGRWLRADVVPRARTEDVPMDAILAHRRGAVPLRLVAPGGDPEVATPVEAARPHLVVLRPEGETPGTLYWSRVHEGLHGLTGPVAARLVAGLVATLWAPATFPGLWGLAITLLTVAALVAVDLVFVSRLHGLRRAMPANLGRAWVTGAFVLAAGLLAADGLLLVTSLDSVGADSSTLDMLGAFGLASRVLAVMSVAVLVQGGLFTLPRGRRPRQSRRANFVSAVAPALALMFALLEWLRHSAESDVPSLLLPLALGTAVVFMLFAVQAIRSVADLAEEADDERRAEALAAAESETPAQ